MHILYVTTEFVTDENFYGGLANFTANIATIFADRNNKITILVAGVDYTEKKFEWKKNIFVEYIDFNKYISINILNKFLDEKPNHKLATNLLYSIRGLIIKEKIKSLNGVSRIDIVHYCNLLAVGLYKNNLIPSVIRMSSYPGIARHTRKESFNINEAIYDLDPLEELELKVIKKNDFIISPSKVTKDLIRQTLNKKVTVIESPFCIALDSCDSNLYEKNLNGKQYLLFFGSLSREKGIYVIEKIIFDFLDRNKDFYFVFIGEEKTRVQVHKLIEKSAGKYAGRVLYFRTMTKNKLIPFISNSYACILPSIMDNFPNTCVEAMGLGKLVIGTYGTSFDQLIKNNHNGLLCKPNSSESLLKTINYAIELDDEQKKTLEKNAQARIDKLNPDETYKNFKKYYNYVINKNKRRNRGSKEWDTNI